MHLPETELARAGSGETDTCLVEHLRWCARCRSAAAEYSWLGERIEDALTATAVAVDVPRPRWRAVKRRMAAGQNRRIAGWRVSATAGIAFAICAVLSLSSIVGVTVAAQTSSPEAVMTPASATAVLFTMRVLSDTRTPSIATPTPIASREGVELSSILTLPPLPPTPPEPDA